MFGKTDLALENLENVSAENPDSEIKGIKKRCYTDGECRITDISVETEDAAKMLGKDIGRYITAEIPSPLSDTSSEDTVSHTVAGIISDMLPEGSVLVAGLGNTDIIPDALGPVAASRIFVTRHIPEELKKETGIEGVRSVSAISVGVLGKTGIESEEIVKLTAGSVNADCVIVIDALAARSINRLGSTIQITDVGISPGSGVKNDRKQISTDTLGVKKVIAIGVPTVVNSGIIAKESGGNSDLVEDMIITPKDIDSLIRRTAKIISKAINISLFPDISSEDLDYLVL